MEVLVIEGFKAEFLPTAELRFIYDWAIDQYVMSGNLYAPTADMFEGTPSPGHKKSLADVLSDNGIDITDVSEQGIEWCIQQLKANWLRQTATVMVTDLGSALNESMAGEMERSFNEDLAKLVATSVKLETRRTATEMVAERQDILDRYYSRKADQNFRGLSLGLPEVDAVTGGIRGDELAVLAAPQKTGKSYMLDRIALKELEAGKSVALCTLENGMDMTVDRIACLATGIHPHRFTLGQLTPDEELAVETWVHDEFGNLPGELWVLKPPMGSRTAYDIVSKARTHKVDSLLIDQLLWMEDADERLPMPQRIRDRVQTLKTMIESASHPMPIVLAHQVTRDGIERAKKANRLWPNDMAEGSAVEQTADWVFSWWQSDDMKVIGQVLMQTLASRRQADHNWDLYWNVETGQMRVMNDPSMLI